ncbi:MAG: sugar phosphate isomerase/epimerase family protein [Anaerolineales bacterium]
MTRKIGIHLSYWQTEWEDDLGLLIRKAHAAGFDVAEFPLLAPHQMDFQGLRSILDETGLEASCGTGLTPETDISHPDPAIREQGITFLERCIAGAQQLGSPVLGGLTYAPWGVFPQDDRAVRKDNAMDSLRKVVQTAEDHNVALCLEVVNRFEGYMINTVQQGLDIIRAIDSNYLKLHLDTFHLNIEADHVGQEIRQAGKHLGHFHCVANNRKRPGAGHLDWQEIKTALENINYQGYLVAETFVNPAGSVGKDMYIWRPLADDFDQHALATANFMKRTFTDV